MTKRFSIAALAWMIGAAAAMPAAATDGVQAKPPHQIAALKNDPAVDHKVWATKTITLKDGQKAFQPKAD